MAKNELLFKDLIALLQESDSPDNLPPNLFDELINASLAVGLANLLKDSKLSEMEALDQLEQIILNHIHSIKSDKKSNGYM